MRRTCSATASPTRWISTAGRHSRRPCVIWDGSRDELGVERYSVAGSSYGGLIAALMWFDRPKRVDNLVLIGTGAVFHPAEEQERTLRNAGRQREPGDGRSDARFLPQAPGRHLLRPTRGSRRNPARAAELVCAVRPVRRLQSDHRGADRDLRFERAPRLHTRLEQLKARTLILTGREDIRAQWRLHVEGRRRMPDARLLIFEKCGHLPYIEQAPAFNNAVAVFLASETVGE
jgi:pimeloyl-ACP methyl ester carboxylesterase